MIKHGGPDEDEDDGYVLPEDDDEHARPLEPPPDSENPWENEKSP